jgi:hypothetical protein
MTESDLKIKETSRREFLKGMAAGPAVALATGSTLLTQTTSEPKAQFAGAPQSQKSI